MSPSPRWAVAHVDARDPATSPGPSADRHLVHFWWGDTVVGRDVLLAADLPMPPVMVRSRFATFAARVVAARLGHPRGAARPHSDGRLDQVPVTGTPAVVAALDDDPGWLERALRGPERQGPTGSVAAVVCTRGRGDRVSATLASLRTQRRPPDQIVVVDNNDRSDESVRAAAADLTYCHEPRPGLSRARNHGIRVSDADIVVFTDDDAVARPGWIEGLLRGFDTDRVGAVTGPALPSTLDGAAAALFQIGYGGLGSGFVPTLFDRGFYARAWRHGVPTWAIGSGVNLAVRRDALAAVGLFDERLGAGAAGCSEDSELLYRLLAAGFECRTEPTALVEHEHRATAAELRAQLGAYARGHVAAQIAIRDRFRDRGSVRRLAWQMPRHFLHRTLLTARRPSRLAATSLASEVRGYGSGLRLLLDRSWRADRDLPHLEADGDARSQR